MELPHQRVYLAQEQLSGLFVRITPDFGLDVQMILFDTELQVIPVVTVKRVFLVF